MKCTACGNENQTSAKFCVHCGVVLGRAAGNPSATQASTIVRAVAAFDQTTTIPLPPEQTAPASAAAGASATATQARGAALPPQSGASAAAATETDRAVATSPSSAPEVLAEQTNRSGLIVAVVAIVVVLGAAGFFGYRMFAVGDESNATSQSPKVIAGAGGIEPVKEAAPPVASANATASGPMSASPSAATGGTSTEEAKGIPLASAPSSDKGAESSKTVVAAEPAKGRTTAPGDSPRATRKAAPPAPAAPKPVDSRPTPAPAPRVAAVTAAAVAEPVAPDRWQLMKDALSHCAREGLLSRIVCEQRERLRYCEGYWGQVAQCPSQTREHGQ